MMINPQTLQNLIGLTLDEARKILSDKNFVIRERRRDQQFLMGTCDHRMDRVNVATDSGVITEVYGIG
jgi:hypothetical protein